MVKHFLRVVAFLLAATFAQAQEYDNGLPLASLYDLQSSSYIYCTMAGTNGVVWNPSITSSAAAPVKTVSSSTTVSAVTAATAPFTNVSIGDQIEFPKSSGSTIKLYRVVTAKASNDSITIDTAVDLSTPATGYTFMYRRRTCGTAATDGWIPVTKFVQVKVNWQMNTQAATATDFRIECRDSGVDNQPVQVWGPGATGYPAAGVTTVGITTSRYAVYIPENWNECRIGSKVTTGTGTNSLTIKISGRQRIPS